MRPVTIAALAAVLVAAFAAISSDSGSAEPAARVSDDMTVYIWPGAR